MTETTTSRAREAMGLGGTQPGQEISLVDKRIARTRSMEAAFADAVASGLSPATLIRDAITALRNTPDLAKCEEQTFFGALMTAAQLGLRPNVGSLGHGWVLPYYSSKRKRHEAQWILGYQGMVELGYKSGLVTKIDAHTIYANEPHTVRFGSNAVLEHEPIFDREKRGDMLLHYAVVHLATGQVLWNVISDLDARDIMARSQSGGRGSGPWQSDYGTMARKTALRGVWRWMPKTEILSLALATDNVVREGVDKDAAVAEQADDAASQPDPTVVEAEVVREETPEERDERQLSEAAAADGK